MQEDRMSINCNIHTVAIIEKFVDESIITLIF